jgi:hypothetical protein
MAAISQPSARSLLTNPGASQVCSQGTTSSAPRAVLLMACFCGDAVMPHR